MNINKDSYDGQRGAEHTPLYRGEKERKRVAKAVLLWQHCFSCL